MKKPNFIKHINERTMLNGTLSMYVHAWPDVTSNQFLRNVYISKTGLSPVNASARKKDHVRFNNVWTT